MFCTKCGVELDERVKFCSDCGSPTAKGLQAQRENVGSRRLVRPMEEKKIGGVCAGFARYVGMDVTLMRVLWLTVAVLTGVGFIAYLVCWIVMPREEAPRLLANVERA